MTVRVGRHFTDPLHVGFAILHIAWRENAKVSRAPMPSILASAVAVRLKALSRVLVSTIPAARSCLRLVWPASLDPPDFRLAEKSGRARRLQTPASSHGNARLTGLGQVLERVGSSRRSDCSLSLRDVVSVLELN